MAEPSEQWLPVEHLDGCFVSSFGRFRGPRGNCTYGSPDKDGYRLVAVNGKTKRLHRLICGAFHGAAPSDRHQVAHLDGSKDNNRPENLVWATARENSHHKFAHGTMLRGEKSGVAKLTEDKVIYIWNSPLGAHRLSREMGLARATILSIRRGETWRAVTDGLPAVERQPQKAKTTTPAGFEDAVAKGASLRQLAADLGVSARTVSRMKLRIAKRGAK